MATEDGGYIYVVHADYGDQGTEPEWNRWYSERHIPDLLSVPGWLATRRYTAVSGAPKYLTIHELESPQVFGSPDHQPVAGWGAWEGHIRNFSRGIFQLMSRHEKGARSGPS